MFLFPSHDRGVRVLNKLLNNCEPLEEIHKKAAQIRTFAKANTLPYQISGCGLIPIERKTKDGLPFWLSFRESVKKQLEEYEDLVDKFIENVDTYIEDAKKTKKTLLKDFKLPSKQTLRSKFLTSFSLSKLPDTNNIDLILKNKEQEEILRKEMEEVNKQNLDRVEFFLKETLKEKFTLLKTKIEALVDDKTVHARFLNGCIKAAKKVLENNVTDN